MKKTINMLLLLAFGYMLTLRFPSWVDAYKMEGKPSPSFTVTKLSESENGLTTFPFNDNKPSILIFWATWCAPCTLELKRYQNAINNGELDGSRIFAISIETDSGPVLKTAKERNYTFQIFIDQSGEAAKKFNVAQTPTMAHVDAKQRVNWIGTGLGPLTIYRAKSHLKSALD